MFTQKEIEIDNRKRVIAFIIPFSIYWLFAVILIGTIAYFTTDTFPIIAIFTVLIYGLLEEIGRRGFLQQLLTPLPKFIGILIINIMCLFDI